MANHHRSARRKAELAEQRAEHARILEAAEIYTAAKVRHLKFQKDHPEFKRLEWASTNFERGGLMVSGSTYSELLKDSSYIKRGKPHFRMDASWAAMGRCESITY